MLGWFCVIQVLDGLSSWTYFGETSTSKLQAETPQYLAREKELAATLKGEKCLVITYIEDGT